MKLQGVGSHDWKTGSEISQKKLFGRRTFKIKNWSMVIVFLLICTGFYYVGRKSVDHEMIKLEDQINAIQNSLGDVNLKGHVSKRDIEGQSQVNERNSVDGDNELEDLVQSSHGGATYIRWGSRTCEGPEQTELLYQGQAAGSEYDRTGGASNVLCIDENVSYTPGKFIDGNQGTALIYGMEYWDTTSFNSLFDFSRTEGESVHGFNVPCAVCMAKGTVNQMMIPGRDSCPTHWKKEYTGYIMAGRNSNYHSHPYLCIDDTPEVVPGSVSHRVDGLLYMVETQCPSLQCEPFVHGRELRCVVCTI